MVEASESARRRVKRLAASYLDAAENSTEHDSDSKIEFASRPLRRYEYLWDEGSYWELERAMDALRAATTRRLSFRMFWAVYVSGSARSDRLAPHKQHAAEQALTFVTEHVRRATGDNIRVPGAVSSNINHARPVWQKAA